MVKIWFLLNLKGDLSLALDILSDILLNSIMDAEEFSREQQVVVQEILQAEDTPDDIIFDPRRNHSPKSGANHAGRLITRRYGGRRRAPSYHGYRGSLPTSCQAVVESTSGLHPLDDDAVDATMSKMCQPAARRSRRRPRGRRVCRGRGSTVEALPRLRKRKLWPIMPNKSILLNGFYIKPV